MALRNKIKLHSAAVGFLALPLLATSAISASADNEDYPNISSVETVAVPPPDIIEWQSSFNLLATGLSNEFPLEYTGSSIDESGNSGWIGFKFSPPEGAVEQINELEKVRIVSNLGYTEDEAEANTLAAGREAIKTLDGGATVVAFRSGMTTEISLLFNGNLSTSSARSASSTKDLEESVEQALPQNSLFTISVERSPDPVVSTESFDGGWAITGISGTCTMSFPVRKNGTHDLGLLTAGHCDGMGSYGGWSQGFFSPQVGSLSTSWGVNGGDFRWNWSREFLSGLTYVGAGPGGTTRITSAAEPSVGATICKYGWRTGHNCARVAYLSVAGLAKPPESNRQFEVGPLRGVNFHITAGGDSGGPWYLGSVGYGIHHGVGAYGSVFSSLPNALRQFNLSLVY